tara:strand:+ start:4424 stop:4996 length:573 start_codon:yes stop_codon:yes gene_type:complete
MQVGYVRVSSIDQCLDRQLDKVELDRVYEEKISGKGRERPQLKECMNYLRDGDTLHVHSMDRLSRSLKDLLNIVSELTDKKVKVKFHTENMEFGGVDNPMGYLMLGMLGSVNQFEIANLKLRQKEGIAKAKARGQQFGRKSLKKKVIQEIYNRKDNNQSVVEISLAVDVGTSTIYKYLGLRDSNGQKTIN